MKKILVPTDFSKLSQNALVFAQNLAKGFKSELVTFHAVKYANLPSEPLSSEEYTAYRTGEKNYYAAEIVRFANEYLPDLIVMGTKGTEGLEEGSLDGITTSVMQQISIPLLAIPHTTSYRPIKEIVYASDFEQDDFKVIDQLLRFAQVTEAIINCIHIRQDGEYWDGNQSSMYDRMYLLEQSNSLINYHVLHGNDILASLQSYIVEHEIDMIAMLTRHNASSFTRKIALSTDIPLLAFHK